MRNGPSSGSALMVRVGFSPRSFWSAMTSVVRENTPLSVSGICIYASQKRGRPRRRYEEGSRAMDLSVSCSLLPVGLCPKETSGKPMPEFHGKDGHRPRSRFLPGVPESGRLRIGGGREDREEVGIGRSFHGLHRKSRIDPCPARSRVGIGNGLFSFSPGKKSGDRIRRAPISCPHVTK